MIAILSGEETPLQDGDKSLSQLIYEALEHSKKVLVTLCYGLTKDNTGGLPLINIDETPWSQELRGSMKPSNKELAVEISCRQRLFTGLEGTTGNKQFSIKPKNKPREVLVEWLTTWPIHDDSCVDFLKTEAHRVESFLQASLDESRENALAMQHGAWVGPIPYLRLIHCLVDCDATRVAFLKRNDVKEREELDSANSPIRLKTGYEIIAAKWNDPGFNPKTRESNCHDEFNESIDLSHTKVVALIPADALGVKNRLSSTRATLL